MEKEICINKNGFPHYQEAYPLTQLAKRVLLEMLGLHYHRKEEK